MLELKSAEGFPLGDKSSEEMKELLDYLYKVIEEIDFKLAEIKKEVRR